MADSLTILANPGHGHGPTVALLLAAEAIQERSGRPVHLIFPYQGQSQPAIVERRRNLAREVQVYYDHTLGALLLPVTLRNNDFRQNVADILAYQEPVQRLAQQYLAQGAITQDRQGNARHFQPGEIDIEINHGSRVRLLDHAYYFFPCLLSDLLQRAEEISEIERRQALAQIEALEAGYQMLFLPQVHTFSWDPAWQPPEKVRYIPFPRPVIPEPPEVVAEGVLVMPSGVGAAGNQRLAQAARAVAAEAMGSTGKPRVMYCPTGLRLAELPEAMEIDPQALGHPKIQLVIGRAGWGTMWECLNAEKSFVAIPPVAGDDPEIAYNVRTLQATGLGLVWQESSIDEKQIQQVRENIVTCLAEIERVFGTRDGLQVMTQEIWEHCTQTCQVPLREASHSENLAGLLPQL